MGCGWPHNLHQGSRGQGSSPARARTARRTAKFLACCVRRAPDDGQAAHGGPGQPRPIHPLAASLASSCRIPSPCRAAGEQPPRESTTRCRLGAARRFAVCLPGSCRAANADGPAGARTAAIGTSTRAGMPPDRWRRPPERRPWSSKSPIGTRLSPLHFLGGGWRAARGRPAGAASLWPRSFLTRPPGRAAGPPRRRCRSSTCAALPPTRTGVLCAGAAASPPRPPPCRLHWHAENGKSTVSSVDFC